MIKDQGIFLTNKSSCNKEVIEAYKVLNAV